MLDGAAHVRFRAIDAETLSRGPIHNRAELGGDEHLVALAGEGFAELLLVAHVEFGGVEMIDAEIDGLVDQRIHVRLRRRRTVKRGQPHAAQPDRVQFRAASAQFALFHDPSPLP